MTTLIEFLEQHLFSCQLKSLFGIDCPGCGMQRAFIALLKGDLKESLSQNASLLPFLGTVFYTVCHLLFTFTNGAKMIVIFFSFTVSVMLFNFIFKLIS